MAGRLRVAGQSDFRTRVFRASESSEAGQPPFPVRHRPAARRREPGIHRIPVRRRHLQDRQACFSGILRWHSSRGFHNHGGACRPAPATGAFRPEPAKPETQTHPPPGRGRKGLEEQSRPGHAEELTRTHSTSNAPMGHPCGSHGCRHPGPRSRQPSKSHPATPVTPAPDAPSGAAVRVAGASVPAPGGLRSPAT